MLKHWPTEERTMMFYESPLRLVKTLEDLFNISAQNVNAL